MLVSHRFAGISVKITTVRSVTVSQVYGWTKKTDDGRVDPKFQPSLFLRRDRLNTSMDYSDLILTVKPTRGPNHFQWHPNKRYQK